MSNPETSEEEDAMDGAPVADRINRLPYETWLSAGELAQLLGLPDEQAVKVLRVGRRRGSITLDRKGDEPLFKRVRRHPRSGARL
ncbi:ubiquitin family protein [Streptomyces bottropensis]|uniref:hypothetical protein n=1 Tax=Streptomyces bottropensis TaxID=42235 RepID=UPI003675D28B